MGPCLAENNIISLSEGNISVRSNIRNVKLHVVPSAGVAKPTKMRTLLSAARDTLRDRGNLCPCLVSLALQSTPHVPCRGQLKQAALSGDFQLGSATGKLWQEIRGREEPEVYIPPHQPTWGALEVATVCSWFLLLHRPSRVQVPRL